MKLDEIRSMVQENDSTGVKILLDALGHDRKLIVNMTTSNKQQTLLYYASEMNFFDIVQLLVEAGADGRSDSANKYTPLYISCYNNHQKLTKYLLDKFPEMTQLTTVENWLPYHAAVFNGHIEIVDMLLNYSYPEHVLQTFNDPSGQYEYRFAFNPNELDASGQTALYTACLLGNRELVERMLDWKVKFLKKERGEDFLKMDPLCQLSPTSGKISSGILSIMTKLGARCDNVDDNPLMKSPLDINILCGATKENSVLAAIRGGFIDLVHVLLSHGADPNIIARNPMFDQNYLRYINLYYIQIIKH